MEQCSEQPDKMWDHFGTLLFILQSGSYVDYSGIGRYTYVFKPSIMKEGI
jgi:hypothetical protein